MHSQRLRFVFGLSKKIHMTDKFRTLLEAKQHDLNHSGNNREAIAVERSADELDHIQALNEREVQTHTIDYDARLMRQVKAALKRMQDGDYGICIECDDPINEKRLTAIPWAERCVACQSLKDDENRIHTVLVEEEDAA